MATGDPMCPTCGQYKMNCVCGRILASMTSGYVHRADTPPDPPSKTTTTAKPGDSYVWWDPAWTTTVTTYKHKPRKRRHFRQAVY